MVDQSAKAILQQTLDQYGLSGLGDWAWNQYLGNGGDMNQVLLDMRNTDEYKARFPAMAELAKRGQAISEASYINYETTVQQLAHSYGLPQGMYTKPDDIANMLLNNVSTSEVNDRLRIATDAAFKAPTEVRQALQDQYGVTPGGLTAYFLDPEKAQPLLEQQWAAAQITGAGAMQGIGVDKTTSEALAARGVTFDQARQGLGQAAQMRGLESGGGDTASQNDLIQAQFGDAQAQRTVQRALGGRLAQFQAGGGAADSASQGVVGLGVR